MKNSHLISERNCFWFLFVVVLFVCFFRCCFFNLMRKVSTVLLEAVTETDLVSDLRWRQSMSAVMTSSEGRRPLCPWPSTARPAACMEEAAPGSTSSPELPSSPGCTEEAAGSTAPPRCPPSPQIPLQPAPCGSGTPHKTEGKSPACK